LRNTLWGHAGLLVKSIKFQIITVLFVQLTALLVIVLTTLYLLNLRQHDYLILNLVGQARILTQTMVNQSAHYLEQAPRDYASYERDLGLFNRDLSMQVDSIENILKSLQQRVIKANLTNPAYLGISAETAAKVPSLVDQDQPIICTWDEQSRSQMTATYRVWQEFHRGLQQSLGTDIDGPRLETAAEYILTSSPELTASTGALASAFRVMMEDKMSQIHMLNKASLVLMLLISVTLVFILYKRVFRPIDHTVAGFNRVSAGDFHHQVPVHDSHELGIMATTFNHLTQRVSTLFRLTDKINQATSLDQTLRFVYEEFPLFLPLDWVGVIRTSHNSNEYHLDRYFTSHDINISEREVFSYPGSVFEQTIQRAAPVSTCVDTTKNIISKDDTFIQRLHENNMHSVVYMPLLENALDTAVLVFAAAQPDSYTGEHLEFLSNIASQVAHSFNKTIGMESLVISTVEGLAKLAESRDPETGDHLFRMSRYSALLAQQLGKTEKYRDLIDSSYVRDILQFAPMHDIGKVGINDSVLLKPGRLDQMEREHMEQHPVIGGAVLRRCEQQMNAVGHSVFTIGIEIAESHHEKFDGSGYPGGLRGENIPLSARIVAAADVFDALTSKRPYKEAWPVDKALDLLNEQAGRHFDPGVIDAMHAALPEILLVYEKYKHV
jgi:response regulator RpfG family c-di-GMP phosphodiesterase/HAMP domain-containing protein